MLSLKCHDLMSQNLVFAILYLFIVPDIEMHILVMDDLDQLVSGSSDPEEWRSVLQVTKLVVEPGDGVIGQTEVGTDAIGSVLFNS